MLGIIRKIVARNEKFLKEQGLTEDLGLPYLREKLFLGIVQTLMVIGFLAFMPGIIMSVIEELWLIVLIDSAAMLVIVLLFFAKAIPSNIRIIILLTVIYLLAVFLLIELGPFGAGFIWLIGFSIIASVFFGLKAAIITIAINLITVILLALAINFEVLDTPFFTEYSIGNWIAVSTNLIVVNALSTISMSLLIRGLQNSLSAEQGLRQRLKKKSIRLIDAKAHAEESDRLKSVFLANMSHELRTPMNSIVGFTNIMLNSRTDAEKRERYLYNIQRSSTQLFKLINDIIEFSIIEAGTLKIISEFLDIEELLIFIKEQLQFQCPPGVDFTMIPPTKNTGNIIWGDRTRLIQILSNLITNSFKFTKEGMVLFGVMKCDEDDMVQFYVQDSGIGIQEEKQENVFLRFYQEDSLKDGAGLGLSICASLVKLMGGKIWLDSIEGEGTTFFFTIPKDKIVVE